MEGIRIGEEAVLKTVGLKGLGGSSPSPSAHCKMVKWVAPKADTPARLAGTDKEIDKGYG